MLGSGRSLARNGHLLPAPHSIFRVLGSAREKPAGVLGQERLNIEEIWLLTACLAFNKVAPCLVSPETNSPSPAQRLVRAGAQKANSYQSTMLERADTAEAIGLNQRASALLDHIYSSTTHEHGNKQFSIYCASFKDQFLISSVCRCTCGQHIFECWRRNNDA